MAIKYFNEFDDIFKANSASQWYKDLNELQERANKVTIRGAGSNSLQTTITKLLMSIQERYKDYANFKTYKEAKEKQGVSVTEADFKNEIKNGVGKHIFEEYEKLYTRVKKSVELMEKLETATNAQEIEKLCEGVDLVHDWVFLLESRHLDKILPLIKEQTSKSASAKKIESILDESAKEVVEYTAYTAKTERGISNTEKRDVSMDDVYDASAEKFVSRNKNLPESERSALIHKLRFLSISCDDREFVAFGSSETYKVNPINDRNRRVELAGTYNINNGMVIIIDQMGCQRIAPRTKALMDVIRRLGLKQEDLPVHGSNGEKPILTNDDDKKKWARLQRLQKEEMFPIEHIGSKAYNEAIASVQQQVFERDKKELNGVTKTKTIPLRSVDDPEVSKFFEEMSISAENRKVISVYTNRYITIKPKTDIENRIKCAGKYEARNGFVFFVDDKGFQRLAPYSQKLIKALKSFGYSEGEIGLNLLGDDKVVFENRLEQEKWFDIENEQFRNSHPETIRKVEIDPPAGLTVKECIDYLRSKRQKDPKTVISMKIGEKIVTSDMAENLLFGELFGCSSDEYFENPDKFKDKNIKMQKTESYFESEMRKKVEAWEEIIDETFNSEKAEEIKKMIAKKYDIESYRRGSEDSFTANKLFEILTYAKNVRTAARFEADQSYAEHSIKNAKEHIKGLYEKLSDHPGERLSIAEFLSHSDLGEFFENAILDDADRVYGFESRKVKILEDNFNKARNAKQNQAQPGQS